MCPPYLSSRPTEDFGKRRNDEGRRRPPKEVNRRGRREDLGHVRNFQRFEPVLDRHAERHWRDVGQIDVPKLFWGVRTSNPAFESLDRFSLNDLLPEALDIRTGRIV